MRELEFLPAWYAQLHRRKRFLILQIWMTLVLAAGLTAWLFLVGRNRQGAQVTLDSLSRQIVQTDTQLREMNRLTALREQLQQQEEVQSKLGVHVEAARLMHKLADLMPASMSLLSINLETEEIAVALSPLERASLRDGSIAPVERRLRVRLVGVAPTDVDLATFITELQRVNFFDQVSMSYVRDRHDGGHMMREFELTFLINLSIPAGS